MSLSYGHKYSMSEALEGAKVIYGEFTGSPDSTGNLALAACACLDYGASVALPVAEGLRAKKFSLKTAPVDVEKCKAEIVEILKPCCEGLHATPEAAEEAAKRVDWAKLAALIAKLIPIILPFVV